MPRLLETGHRVRVLVRDPERIAGRSWIDAVEVRVGDLLRPETLIGVAEGQDSAYYLVHAMTGGGDFAERDRRSAENFVSAAPDLDHVIYLGGLLPSGEARSQHLSSRAKVGEILAGALPTTEFRAGPIIGSGSASFEMVRYLTERLPAMIAPKWILNEVQPIAVRDTLAYLLAALERKAEGVVEIGGEALTFRQMMLEYAAERGLGRIIVPVPVLAPRLAALWVGLVTPIPNALAVPLIQGIVEPVVAPTDRARTLFPSIAPVPYREAVSRALRRTDTGAIETRWSGALGSGSDVVLEDWQGLIREVQRLAIDAPPEAAFRAFTSLGGDHGWLVWGWAWRLRGLLDRLVGGPGLRRNRRHPSELLAGEALDFWRVEAIVPGRLLRLRAEMRVPGKAWLEFEAIQRSDGTELIQTAIFEPKGLAGTLYWYLLYPIHRLIFRDMVRAVAREAERLSDTAPGRNPVAG